MRLADGQEATSTCGNNIVLDGYADAVRYALSMRSSTPLFGAVMGVISIRLSDDEIKNAVATAPTLAAFGQSRCAVRNSIARRLRRLAASRIAPSQGLGR